MRFERTLVVLKNYLGDTVMASPLVRSIHADTAQLSILGSPVTEQLLRFPNFSAQFTDPGNLGNAANLFRQATVLRRQRFEAAILVNRSFRSALLVRLARIPVRVGHDTEGRGVLLTHRVEYDLEKNEALCYLDLAHSIGIEPKFGNPELWISEAEREQGRQLVRTATVGVQPGARHEYKQVPIRIQTEVIEALKSKGCKVAYLGGKEERSLLARLPTPDVDLIGSTTIRETIAALANLRLVVGGDTGVMHMAAAIGTPTITVFGPTPAKKWGWFQHPHQVIQANNGDISQVDAESINQAVEKVLCDSS